MATFKMTHFEMTHFDLTHFNLTQIDMSHVREIPSTTCIFLLYTYVIFILDKLLECTYLSKEQIVTVNIELSNEDKTQNVHSRVHLVLVVDKSGSMAGQPWNQVSYNW